MTPADKFKEELRDLLWKHSAEIYTKAPVDLYLGDLKWDLTVKEQDVRLEPRTRYGRIPE